MAPVPDNLEAALLLSAAPRLDPDTQYERRAVLRTSVLQVTALVVPITLIACSGSPSPDGSAGEGATGGNLGGQSGSLAYGYDAGGLGGWAAAGIDGGAWGPSTGCVARASALVAAMTPSQRYGQMTTVDSNGLTVSEATTQLLGSVFSGVLT